MNPIRPFGFAAILAGALLVAAPGYAQRGDEEARRQLAEQSRRIEDLRQQLTRMEESLRSMSATGPALGLVQARLEPDKRLTVVIRDGEVVCLYTQARRTVEVLWHAHRVPAAAPEYQPRPGAALAAKP